jgi:hypothetical protein
MRIACLVVAYNAASVLRSALAIYAKLGWDVFVHLDRKADIGVYREALGERGNFCRFVEGPLAVFWGGFSMMRAEFRLIERALSSGSYDRFVLLSDDSFPVRSLVDLQKLLAEDVDRITAVRQPEGSDFYKRYHGYFYFDHGATNPRGGLHGREIDEALVGKIAEARDLMLRGKKLIDIYFGSQFWILQQSTIEDIVELCHSDAHLQKSLEFSALPDELMFQSVFGSYLRNRFYTHGPVFSDFSRGHGPLTYSSFNQLPPEFPEHIAFIRKVDAKATLFLRELEDRMIAGGWFGLPPTSLTSSVASIKTRCASLDFSNARWWGR